PFLDSIQTSCNNCGESLVSSVKDQNRFAHRITQHLKNLIGKYYELEYICSNKLCNFKTKMPSVVFYHAKRCPGCNMYDMQRR
ncbi:MAG: hypothetical protein MHPSP_004210, partial [Paramarteilia canceri]